MTSQRVSKDIHDFAQKLAEDMQLDVNDWSEQSISKMISNMFDASDLSQVADMFGDFDAPGMSSMFSGGVKQKTAKFDPYVVMSLDRGCTNEEVKERYRELMAIIHPDKTQGKTNHFAKLVNIAYEQIKKKRGLA